MLLIVALYHGAWCSEAARRGRLHEARRTRAHTKRASVEPPMSRRRQLIHADLEVSGAEGQGFDSFEGWGFDSSEAHFRAVRGLSFSANPRKACITGQEAVSPSNSLKPKSRRARRPIVVASR